METNSSEEELELTRQLVQALTREDLEMAEYRDEYTEKTREIIEAKVAGQEVVSPPAEAEEPQVVNLMEALKASVKRIAKPEKKIAASAAVRGAHLLRPAGPAHRGSVAWNGRRQSTRRMTVRS